MGRGDDEGSGEGLETLGLGDVGLGVGLKFGVGADSRVGTRGEVGRARGNVPGSEENDDIRACASIGRNKRICVLADDAVLA